MSSANPLFFLKRKPSRDTQQIEKLMTFHDVLRIAGLLLFFVHKQTSKTNHIKQYCNHKAKQNKATTKNTRSEGNDLTEVEEFWFNEKPGDKNNHHRHNHHRHNHQNPFVGSRLLEGHKQMYTIIYHTHHKHH